MSRRCKLTGIGPLTANAVSHSNIKTKKRQLPNLQSKRLFVPELKRYVQVRVSTRALRTIDKKGLIAFLRDEGLALRDVL